jgi:hypothetical protein
VARQFRLAARKEDAVKIETVRKLSDVCLDGISVDGLVDKSSVRQLRLTDRLGNVVIVERGTYDGLAVMIKARPEMVEKWRVVGVMLSLNISELFDTEGLAIDRIETLTRKSDGDASLSYSKEMVPKEDE